MRCRTFIRAALAAAATVAIPQHQLLAALYQPLRQDVPDIPAVTGDGRELTLNGRDIANHEPLVAVKNQYDPSNLFRLSANVKPTV
ncbi:MAG: BBE domain-containing protein [Gammaproteobacteria bacterium]